MFGADRAHGGVDQGLVNQSSADQAPHMGLRDAERKKTAVNVNVGQLSQLQPPATKP
ncbi:MAG TPA: hypothetical protein PLQ67_01195 [Burkholderiaceae bacterium]|nr:hypothetical protein [Burkholderiaceae bacterium]